ncbi:ABC transporter, transmembrane domain, type 1 [Niveomyces insectorum RCEF 264]|uniref:ABC transporter, transmembrane domain, type 1 n=1 Tax=Niveomyces insectorum RCEF 264 TaxID=1081102 RepID=A0A167WG05_9HYPO|nr:ABC transporter, transmembrane domain, type 1 [Niveomyces insectorum RCEF 264]
MQVVLLFAVQPYLALTLPVCAVIVYVVQKRYLRTSRQLRRIELESQSAIYFNFLETIQGLSTIQTFQWRKPVALGFAACLDEAQQPLYLRLCLQRWLNVVLDMVVACLAVGIVWLAVAATNGAAILPLPTTSAGTITGGQVGVALNIILVTNTTLLRLVQAWTNLEISLGAVARLREAVEETPQEENRSEVQRQHRERWRYGNIENAGRLAGNEIPNNWPEAGDVKFSNVTASYR